MQELGFSEDEIPMLADKACRPQTIATRATDATGYQGSASSLRHGSHAQPERDQEMTIDVAKTVKKMFVDGKWVESESGETFAADSPATGEVIAQVPKGTRADAVRAIEAAHKAKAEMAKLKGFDRSTRLYAIAEAIEKRRDDLAHLLTLDQGKPLKAEAYGEVAECVEYFKIAAEDLKRLEGRVLPSSSPTKLVLTRHYPRGVYGIITPWNGR
jgi:delta 1-pyrroline-5-carboxylate dehydrogenase